MQTKYMVPGLLAAVAFLLLLGGAFLLGETSGASQKDKCWPEAGGSDAPVDAAAPAAASGGSTLQQALSLIPGTEQTGLPTQTVTIRRADGQGVSFTAQVASTEDERERGLMYRKTLGEHEGMLFLFPKAEPLTFWMKNTEIPLDIVFIREGGEIANIVTGQPEDESLLKSLGDVKAVLEIGGGVAAKEMLRPGDHVEYTDSPSGPER